jgi:sulfate transport system permease protein
VGGWLENLGVQVIFSTPGMVMAAVFISLPLVVRAVIPVLEELGDEQEQAARTLGAGGWQTFRRITIPGIRWALAYGVVLCLARALGEYGAVAVVSGRLVEKTQTLTLFVEERFQNFDQGAAFAAATALALVAVITLLLTKILRPKG